MLATEKRLHTYKERWRRFWPVVNFTNEAQRKAFRQNATRCTLYCPFSFLRIVCLRPRPLLSPKEPKEPRVYEEVYFPVSIPPCVSRYCLAFGAIDLSFLNSIRARSPCLADATIETMREGIESFALSLPARASIQFILFANIISFIHLFYLSHSRLSNIGVKGNTSSRIQRKSECFLWPE